jgi:non-lysosomal glucosylceramidase
MRPDLNARWPVLKSYDADHLLRIALPLGGIGTGTVSLGGPGDLRDFEIVNRPAKGWRPGEPRPGLPGPSVFQRRTNTFFALYARPEGGEAVSRAIEGPVHVSAYEGSHGSGVFNHGLPRFSEAEFHAAYPFGQVTLSDPDVPLDVRLEAFNPFIPGDTDASSIPAAVFRFVLSNPGPVLIDAAVCGSLENFVGTDGFYGDPSNNTNEFRDDGVRGIFMQGGDVPANSEQWGTIALTTTATDVSHRTAWPILSWGDSLLDFWGDFSNDGRLEPRSANPPDSHAFMEYVKAMVDAPIGSLSASVSVPAGETVEVAFLLSWHFPNRLTWDQNRQCGPDGDCDCGDDEVSKDFIGNYYATQYEDAWDVAVRTTAELDDLEDRTITFVRAFVESDLPEVVKEAALFNLSTLRTQTCFRTPDGRFYGWEGCFDDMGCCPGSCNHVWNYEQSTAFLFGDLSRTMREVEFSHATNDAGLMSFRVGLPLADRAREWEFAAADGQMGCIMKLYRDWQLSGDDDFLRAQWPGARRALEFCWIEGGWDADQDGVMEGCQHNTMDVEYYGPNPEMTGWYLGALRSAEEMARHLGEDDLAAKCRRLFESGRDWMDANLFNGEYYEHEVRPQPDVGKIAPGIRHKTMAARNLTDPELQLASGCLVDQLVGQYFAHVAGLGYLHDPEKIDATLRAIMKYNFRDSLGSHFNHMRDFALGDEAALLMVSYPHDRPERPTPRYNEVMTGFEYTAAIGMLYEGQNEEGLRVIEAVRDRYDGLRRSPFDEAECGHHYARAMIAWAAVLALTGFQYSGVAKSMTFASRPGSHFWSNGSAWGVCRQSSPNGSTAVELEVLGGSVELSRFNLTGVGEVTFDSPTVVATGETLNVSVGA